MAELETLFHPDRFQRKGRALQQRDQVDQHDLCKDLYKQRKEQNYLYEYNDKNKVVSYLKDTKQKSLKREALAQELRLYNHLLIRNIAIKLLLGLLPVLGLAYLSVIDRRELVSLVMLQVWVFLMGELSIKNGIITTSTINKWLQCL